MMTALTPGLITLGAFMAVVPLLRRDSTMARSFLAVVSLVFLLRYLYWRVTATLPPPHLTADAVIGYPFMLLEAASLVAVALSLLFLSRTIDRTGAARIDGRAIDPHAPLIDVLICTYNEERSILERTIIGATGMEYGNYRVWVLDDGRRPWLRRLASELGCHYLARPDNHHAKAGNINHALKHVGALPERPDFVAILDADFVPRPDFLARTISLMDDASVGVVQTPQHFINPDPIQTNLAATDVWPDEQRFFFDILLPAKDAWGVAFCCGTSSLIRYTGLVQIGGFPTDSVTEDYLVTLRLKERGFNTIYLNERLTIGLAPEGLKEYITQRARWCLGLMQIVRGRSGPFSQDSKLSFIDRLSLVDAFMSWSAVYTSKVAGLMVPWLFLLFGIKAVQADLTELLRFFLPFYVWHGLSMAWLSHGRFARHDERRLATHCRARGAQGGGSRPVEAGGTQVQGHGEGRRPRQEICRMAAAADLWLRASHHAGGHCLCLHPAPARREHRLWRTGPGLEPLQRAHPHRGLLRLHRAATQAQGGALRSQ
ncbi:cellulose synthase/poly-beta-1,6-N-acetylglucosamine synthase-like glycosyltransferase [Bradyrhizobium diazoefficiens]